MNREECIHIWVPGIREGAGGIQAFSRVYVQAICEAYPQARVRVLVKNDAPAADDPLLRLGVRFHSVAGCASWLRTTMLVLVGLGHGLWERPACAVATHLHFLPALRWLKWLRGVRVMGVLHGIEAWDLRPGVRVQALRDADHLMAVSRHTRQVVIDSYGIQPERVSVVPNTFETGRFAVGPKPEHLLRRYGLKPDQPVILTVSRLVLSERYKGHRQVLVALETVRRRFPNVCYLVVGTGDDLPDLREFVAARGLQDQVILAGHVPGDELPDHYRLCDVFAMPSSKEGFGIVFLEAMASGKPVIAGNLDGSVDALDEGRLGVLVDPNDAPEIASAICQVLDKKPDGALWHQPQSLREAVVTQFGYARVSRLLADDLAPLLSRERRLSSPMAAPTTVSDNWTVAPRILVLTQLTSPYQVEFFNALSAAGGFHLEVVYLTSQDRARQWQMPDIAHNHLILSETPHLRHDAMAAILKADLVIFNYYTDWFALRAIRGRARGRKPWVFWGERPGFFQTGQMGVMARWFLLKPLHRHAAPIWAVGSFGVGGYQREFGRSRSYQNIPYFSNLTRFRQIERQPEASRVFLYSGSFSHRKGSDLLAAAFAKVAARHPQARLVLVGSGDMEVAMRNLLQPCADRVTWLGFQPWEKLPECYAQGSIFCFPSRYDGWGLALVEALAAGMPAIGTDRTGAAIEFLSDRQAGWLVEAGAGRDFEQAMEAALTLPEAEFRAMQAAARAAVTDNGLEEGVRRFVMAAEDVLAHWQARMPGDPA
jgi:glycosyltransferase involved in cell wall biosynthesis